MKTARRHLVARRSLPIARPPGDTIEIWFADEARIDQKKDYPSLGEARQRRDAAAAWLCCNAAGLLETLHSDHHQLGLSVRLPHAAGTVSTSSITRARKSTE